MTKKCQASDAEVKLIRDAMERMAKSLTATFVIDEQRLAIFSGHHSVEREHRESRDTRKAQPFTAHP